MYANITAERCLINNLKKKKNVITKNYMEPNRFVLNKNMCVSYIYMHFIRFI